MNRLQSLALLAAVSLATLTSGSALAQIATVKAVETAAYSSLENWDEKEGRPLGMVETIAVDGHHILQVAVQLDIAWSEAVDQVRVQSRDIALVLSDGTEVAAFGTARELGRVSTNGPSLSARRPRDFPEKDEDAFYFAYFLVPQGQTEATLKLGGDLAMEVPVSIPELSQQPTAPEFADVAVRLVRVFKVANTEDRDLTMTLRPPEGHVFVELTLDITPRTANETDGDASFSYATTDFHLGTAEGQSYPLAGQRFMKRVLDSFPNTVKVGDTQDRTILWAVPEDVTAATLYFTGVKIAEVDWAGQQVLDQDRAHGQR